MSNDPGDHIQAIAMPFNRDTLGAVFPVAGADHFYSGVRPDLFDRPAVVGPAGLDPVGVVLAGQQRRRPEDALGPGLAGLAAVDYARLLGTVDGLLGRAAQHIPQSFGRSVDSPRAIPAALRARGALAAGSRRSSLFAR